jgi:uncharacterized membrane protein YkvA (DUF1232 family)
MMAKKQKRPDMTFGLGVIFGVRLANKMAAWLKAAVFGGLALAYIFWALDVVPDALGPVVGRVDDTIVFLIAAWGIKGAINTILDKKDAFLGRTK